MKHGYKLIVSFLFAFCAFIFASSMQADEKLYVYFDDIGIVHNSEGTPINIEGYAGSAADYIYYEPLTTNNQHTPNILKTGYGDFFSSGKSITDYEIAVFYMGDKPLQYSAGGHRVVTEIKNMLDAGKRVILIGNGLLFWAFDPESNQRDQEVQSFFEDYMGITADSYRRINTTQGTSFKPFAVKGIQNVPNVILAYMKICNMAHGINNVEPLHPWRYRTFIDAFDKTRLDSSNISPVPIEFFSWTTDWSELSMVMDGDSLVGIRAENDYKIVFWSSGFEVGAASSHMPNWRKEMYSAINWCVEGLPKPGPWLEFGSDPLDFETVAVEETIEKELKIWNNGRETLEIYDFYLEGFADYGVFSIETDQREFTIAPGDEEYISIKFMPQEEKKYEEYLDFESNSGGGQILGVTLVGWGGKKPEQGPQLSIFNENHTLDFGTVSPTEIDTLPLVLANTGIDLLMIDEKFLWENEKKGVFRYAKPYTWPISLYPEETDTTLIKFFPLNQTGEFLDSLAIIPDNATNVDTVWVYLKGESREGATDAEVSLTTNEIGFDSTGVGDENFSEFEIENTGSKVLYISKLKVEEDYERTFVLFDKYDEEISEQPHIPLFLAGHQKTRKVKVRFTPSDTGYFETRVAIEFMDEFDEPIPSLDTYVDVSGVAKEGVGVEDELSSGARFAMQVVPHPVENGAYLEYALGGDRPANVKIVLTDMLGSNIQEIIKTEISSGVHRTPLDVSSLASGMYYITAYVNGKVYQEPVIIEK